MTEEKTPDQTVPSLPADLLSAISGDTTPEMREVGRGYASDAYIATFSDRPPLVILQEKESPHQVPEYSHYFAMAKLLQSKGVPVVAPEVFISADQHTLASTYIEGDDINEAAEKLDREKRLELFYRVIDAAYGLESISYEAYKQKCDELGITPKKPLSYAESMKSFSIEWLDIVRDRCPDHDLQAWCEEHITKSLERAKRMFTDKPPVLIHGDLTEGNIIVEKDTSKVYFVDWAAADYIQVGDESYVSYMTNLVSSMKPFRDEILRHVAEARGHDVQEFRKRVYEFELLSHPFDVLWAVMMYTKASRGEVKDEPAKFLDIARRRIDDYARLAKAASTA